MDATYLDRRQVLKGLGAGALAVGATAVLSPVTALAADDRDSLLGAWSVNLHPAGQASRPAVAGFAAGGVFTSVDSQGPGAVGLGAWDKEEDKHFAFKFTAFDFSRGQLAVVTVSASGTVDENSIHGTFSATVNGSPAGSGTFDGTRMTV
jgi:hypothetical protein